MEKTTRQEHILVGLSSAPSNARIIRTAATMAKAFGGSFTALFVRTPDHADMSPENRRRLRENTCLAQELGATVETVFGEDVSYQIAEYARLSGVTKVVVGRSAAKRKYFWSKPTLTEQLTRIAPALDVHIIPDASVPPVYRQKKGLDGKRMLRDWAATALILLLTTLLGWAMLELGFHDAHIMTVYMLAVVLTAVATTTRSSYVLVALGSILLYNFVFAQPRLSFASFGNGYPVSLVLMLTSSLIVGTLTDKLGSQAKQSAQAAYRTNLLLETNQLLQQAGEDGDILEVARCQTEKLLGETTLVIPGTAARAEGETALHFPIRTREKTYGTIVVKTAEEQDAFENSVLLSILGECALALQSSDSARQMENAKRQMENEKLRSDLLRSISHDLRTPLTSISGNAGMLLNSAECLDDAIRRRMYRNIHDDAVWLTGLVENLLAITRMEQGQPELKKQPHLVEELVSEAMGHINRRENTHVIQVKHEDELLLLHCDARLLVQVIVNLMDNAMKYTPAGSSIHITTCRQGDMGVIRVADNGTGIPDGEKEKVFDMFYTGKTTVADSRRSLGLGLHLCRSIAVAHGGSITLADGAEGGAVFSVMIPAEEVIIHE